jgi:hypothetical protein
MNIINLSFLLCFMGHGLCDFLPLLQTLNKNILINYIFFIFINCYVYTINHSISTLIFIIISSMHFSEDFYPFNKIKFPGLGFYILGAPILSDYTSYYECLDFIDIQNKELFLLIMYFGGILGIINTNIKYEIFFIIVYTIISLFFGIYSVLFYMLYYHLPISIIILSNKYKLSNIFIILGLGTLLMLCIYVFCYTLVIDLVILYKDYFIGIMFGILNSHSLTTILWRSNEKILTLFIL